MKAQHSPFLKSTATALTLLMLAAPLHAGAGGGQLFKNLGDYRRDVTTDSAEAQALFDQGIQLLY